MDSDKSQPKAEHHEIPRVFYSSETSNPFEYCMVCNKYLLQEGTSYMIEKAMKYHPEFNTREVIFEYAICMECSIQMHEALSEETKERIAAYFEQHAIFAYQRNKLIEQKNFNTDTWIDRCLVKDTAISKSTEYQLVAQCSGKNVVFNIAPFALSFEAMEEVSGLMSAKSLGEMDDFIGKYFSGPPEVAEILKRRIVLI